jgi:hypothetical protein
MKRAQMDMFIEIMKTGMSLGEDSLFGAWTLWCDYGGAWPERRAHGKKAVVSFLRGLKRDEIEQEEIDFMTDDEVWKKYGFAPV